MKRLLPFFALGFGASFLLDRKKKKRSARKLESPPATPESPNDDERLDIRIYVFEATWCAVCARTKPALLEVSKSHPNIPFQFVDFDEERDLAIQFNITALPTVIAMVDGKEVERIEGKGSASQYEQMALGAANIASGAIPLPASPEGEKKKLPPG